MTPSRSLLLALVATWLSTNQVLAAASGEAIGTSAFDLGDVLCPMIDFPGPSPAETPLWTAFSSHPASAVDTPISFIRRIFEPGVADLIIAHSTVHGSVVTITGASALLDHISTVMASERARRFSQVQTDVHEVMMDPALRQDQFALKELAWKELPGSRGLAFATLTAAQHRALEGRWSRQDGISCTFHPDITAFSGQLAYCCCQNSISYPMLGFSAGGPAVEQGLVNVGDLVRVQATLTEDHRFIHLVLQHDRASLLDLASVTIGFHADGSRITAEEPLVASTQERIDQVIENGASVLISTGMYLEKDQISPRRIPAHHQPGGHPDGQRIAVGAGHQALSAPGVGSAFGGSPARHRRAQVVAMRNSSPLPGSSPSLRCWK